MDTKKPQPNRKLDLESVRFYGYAGKYYPSVTSIKKAHAKGEGYERWLGNATSYKDAMGYRDERRDEGLEVHRRVASFVKHRDPNKWRTLRGYMKSLGLFLEVMGVRPILMEEPIVNTKAGFGGTLDMLASVQFEGEKSKSRTVAVIDFKTSKQLHVDDQPLQIGPYWWTVRKSGWANGSESRMPTCGMLVRLSATGEFSPARDIHYMGYRECMSAYGAFRGLQKVFKWEHRNEYTTPEELEAHTLKVKNPKILVQ